MRDTVRFAIKLDPDYAQSTALTPFPGTPLFHLAEREGLIEDRNWENCTTLKAVVRGYYFTRWQLQRMVSEAYRLFYGRLSFLIGQLKKRRVSVLLSMLKGLIVPWALPILRKIRGCEPPGTELGSECR